MTNLLDEVESGDRRRALKAVRRLLAERIAEGPRPRELAALSWRLMKVMEQLDEERTPLPRQRRRSISDERHAAPLSPTISRLRRDQ